MLEDFAESDPLKRTNAGHFGDSTLVSPTFSRAARCVQFFHVATVVYPNGTPLSIPTGESTRFHAGLTGMNGWVAEARLEAHRPDDAQPRRNALYAFGNPNHCAVYGTSQYKAEPLYYYRVVMPRPLKAPMAFVDVVGKINGLAGSLFEQIAREYWSPTRAWSFWEYLDASMTIVERILAPDITTLEFMGANGSWDNDIDLARRFGRYVVTGDPGWLATLDEDGAVINDA